MKHMSFFLASKPDVYFSISLQPTKKLQFQVSQKASRLKSDIFVRCKRVRRLSLFVTNKALFWNLWQQSLGLIETRNFSLSLSFVLFLGRLEFHSGFSRNSRRPKQVCLKKKKIGSITWSHFLTTAFGIMTRAVRAKLQVLKDALVSSFITFCTTDVPFEPFERLDLAWTFADT